MSTAGVKRRMIDILRENNGQVSAPDYESVVTYAKAGGLSVGEREALVQPSDYLTTAADRGEAAWDGSEIAFDADAARLARRLAAEAGLTPLPGRPEMRVQVPLPTASDLEHARANRRRVMSRGRDLGTFRDWTVTTSGATARFWTGVSGQSFPALVLDRPEWVDPASRQLVREHWSSLRSASSAKELKHRIRELVRREADYFAARDVAEDPSNRRYAIQSVRRRQFFDTLRPRITELSLPEPDRVRAGLVLVQVEEEMVSGRQYTMEVGAHQSYWPYDDVYLPPLLKMLEQTPRSSSAYPLLKNRISDILRRKTIFDGNDVIEEQDLERTIGGAVIDNPPFGSGSGPRVSIQTGTGPLAPGYEVLTVSERQLPVSLSTYAGARVVRDGRMGLCVGRESLPSGLEQYAGWPVVPGEAPGSYRFSGFDVPEALANTPVPELLVGYLQRGYVTTGFFFDLDEEDSTPQRAGQAVPSELLSYLEARRVEPTDLGLRPLEKGEQPRSFISVDWDQNGLVNLAALLTSWWGHCHNQAPLQVMGIDPQTAVELYRADRGLRAEAARRAFTAEDAWDVAGAFAADHEDGYVDAEHGTPAGVSRVSFVGQRNDGGHSLHLALSEPAGGRTDVAIDAVVEKLWHPGDPTRRVADPSRLFRRDIENGDGTFSPNPIWVRPVSAVTDDDQITVDLSDRRVSLRVSFRIFDDAGRPTEEKRAVVLDPSRDGMVVIGTEIGVLFPAGGGTIIEHRFNPHTREYERRVMEVSVATGFARRVREQNGPVRVVQVASTQETLFDSVLAIHDFVMADLGTPFVFDTSPGASVWNYPVREIAVTVTGSVERTEADGQTYTYTTYRMRYQTTGDEHSVAYIIKYDAAGNKVRALALDPMPDFAFRREHWVCAPIAVDGQGRLVINRRGLDGGYLTDESRTELDGALWERQAEILFASLSEHPYVFEQLNGHLVAFETRPEFEAAVAADQALRELERALANP